MNKYQLLIIFYIILLLSPAASAQDRATGIFVAFGVGPRLPISDFSRSTEVGYGLNVELAYTDNEFLPVFLFGKLGFEQYPGSQNFYEATSYSNFATTSIPLHAGARYYLKPLLENVMLFMPYIELAAAFNYYSKLHQFKTGSGRSNYTEDNIKTGGSAGLGLSMFLMEILVSYNYFLNNQFISLDLKVRLPLYITY